MQNMKEFQNWKTILFPVHWWKYFMLLLLAMSCEFLVNSRHCTFRFRVKNDFFFLMTHATWQAWWLMRKFYWTSLAYKFLCSLDSTIYYQWQHCYFARSSKSKNGKRRGKSFLVPEWIFYSRIFVCDVLIAR